MIRLTARLLARDSQASSRSHGLTKPKFVWINKAPRPSPAHVMCRAGRVPVGVHRPSRQLLARQPGANNSSPEGPCHPRRAASVRGSNGRADRGWPVGFRVPERRLARVGRGLRAGLSTLCPRRRPLAELERWAKGGQPRLTPPRWAPSRTTGGVSSSFRDRRQSTASVRQRPRQNGAARIVSMRVADFRAPRGGSKTGQTAMPMSAAAWAGVFIPSDRCGRRLL